MRRTLGIATMGLMLLTASSAFAAEETVAPVLESGLAAAASLSQSLSAASLKRAVYTAPQRPMILPGLYAGSALLQAYDGYSTLRALHAGAHEANPMMKAITKNPTMFLGLKAGMATMSILSAERMWKHGNRVGAIATMAVSNGFMAYVAHNNARVIGQVSR